MMIIASRIPGLTEQLRAATRRAADQQREDAPVRQLIQHLERPGSRVTPPQRAA